MISIFAAMNGSILSGSRVPYAMARDGYFFRSLATVDPRYRTPSASILLLGVWSSAILLTGRYDDLYTLVIFPSWILYGMTAASVIVLRRKRPDLDRPYRVLGTLGAAIVRFRGYAAALFDIAELTRESGIGLVLIDWEFPSISIGKAKLRNREGWTGGCGSRGCSRRKWYKVDIFVLKTERTY